MEQAKKILVVEDNEVNMKLVRTLLRMDRYTIIERKDARDIVEVVKKNMPDLVLLDLGLPEVDGITAAKMIKSHPELRRIPVVALTAHVLDSYKKECENVGFDGFIGKPIDTRGFRAQIRSFLAKTEGTKNQG